jgi:hypothetical protein
MVGSSGFRWVLVPSSLPAYDFAVSEKRSGYKRRRNDPQRPPLPEVAIEGRRNAWVFTRERLLVEFLESE